MLVIPRRARNLTVGAEITLISLGDARSACEVPHSVRDDRLVFRIDRKVFVLEMFRDAFGVFGFDFFSRLV